MKTLNTAKTSWDLAPLLTSDNDPKIVEKRKKIEDCSYVFINKWKDRSDYLEDPLILKEALDEFENWSKFFDTDGDEGYYFHLRSSIDQNNPDVKAHSNKIEEFSRKIQNDIQFFAIRLSKVSSIYQEKFLNEPSLQPYHHYLEKLFKKSQYVLSEPEEKILTLKSQTSHSNWVAMTEQFLSKEEVEVQLDNGKTGKKTITELLSLISSKNKQVRDSAGSAINTILEEYADIAEHEINSILANKKINDELRKVHRPDLMRHLYDDIDSEVVDTLVKAVSDKFDIAQRYYTLKAKLLGQKNLEYHERNVEYGEINKKYSYPESAELVYQVCQNLDSEFAEIFSNFTNNGQIDVYPQVGKRGGAFCSYHLPTQPTYILLNHTDKLNDVLTLAHELGHGINDELVKKNQNALNFGTPLSTAEVASTFMEDFVFQQILKSADDETKLAIMMMKLNDDVSTIFRQIACYKFEQSLHQSFREKGYLAKADIGKIFQENMSAYMGPSVDQSKGSENWWVYWSHIRSFFYVYSYSSGLIISKSLQSFVKKDKNFIQKVKVFLSTGLSDSPENIFRNLGIDIADKNFWSAGLQEVEDLLQETEQLAKSLGKIS